eukprot:2113111-Rhodomonas_salina.1
MQYPVLTRAMILGNYYAMSGTDIGCATTRFSTEDAWRTVVASPLSRYAVSTRCPVSVSASERPALDNVRTDSAYAPMPCLVLTQHSELYIGTDIARDRHRPSCSTSTSQSSSKTSTSPPSTSGTLFPFPITSPSSVLTPRIAGVGQALCQAGCHGPSSPYQTPARCYLPPALRLAVASLPPSSALAMRCAGLTRRVRPQACQVESGALARPLHHPASRPLVGHQRRQEVAPASGARFSRGCAVLTRGVWC